MNPFAKTVAGLFSVVGPQSNTPLEAERICSALIQKLSDEPSRNLDPRTWQNAVQMVPSQVESATTSQTLNRTMPIGDLPGVRQCRRRKSRFNPGETHRLLSKQVRGTDSI
jgi:hypothetical protein